MLLDFDDISAYEHLRGSIVPNNHPPLGWRTHAYICGLAWENQAFYELFLKNTLLWAQPTRTRNQSETPRLWSSDNLYDKSGIKEQNIQIKKLWPNANLWTIFMFNIWKNPRFGKSKTECKTTMESFHKNLWTLSNALQSWKF